jgi:hypothetical protein
VTIRNIVVCPPEWSPGGVLTHPTRGKVERTGISDIRELEREFQRMTVELVVRHARDSLRHAAQARFLPEPDPAARRRQCPAGKR